MFEAALLWLIMTDSLVPPATCLNVKFSCGCDSHERWPPASTSVSRENFIYTSNRPFRLDLQNRILSLGAVSDFMFHQSGLYLIVYWSFFKGESKYDGKVKAFRDAFSRIGDARAFLPHANYLSLTATATNQVTAKTAASLQLTNPVVLWLSPDKTNLL